MLLKFECITSSDIRQQTHTHLIHKVLYFNTDSQPKLKLNCSFGNRIFWIALVTISPWKPSQIAIQPLVGHRVTNVLMCNEAKNELECEHLCSRWVEVSLHRWVSVRTRVRSTFTVQPANLLLAKCSVDCRTYVFLWIPAYAQCSFIRVLRNIWFSTL